MIDVWWWDWFDVWLVLCFPSNLECWDPKEGTWELWSFGGPSRKPHGSRLPRWMTICPRKVGKHQSLWFEISFLLHPSSYIDLLHSNLWNWTFSIRECVSQNPWQKSNHKHVVMTSLVELWTLCPQNQLFFSLFSACWIFAGAHVTPARVITSQITILWSIFFSLWCGNHFPNLRPSKTNTPWSFVCLVGDFLQVLPR